MRSVPYSVRHRGGDSDGDDDDEHPGWGGLPGGPLLTEAGSGIVVYGLGSGRLGPPSFGRDEFAEWLRGWHAKYDTDFPIETRIPLSKSFTAVRRCTTCTAPYRQISTIGRWQCRWVYLFPPATGTVWGPVDHRADGEAEMGNEEDGYVDVPLSAFIMIPKYENLWTRLISLNILRGDIDGHTGTYEGDQAWIRVARRPLDFDPHTAPPG